MTTLAAIAALATATALPAVAVHPAFATHSGEPETPALQQRAEVAHHPIQLVDRVVAGSDFDQFRDRLWQAVQRRDAAFVQALLPSEGIFVGQAGPVTSDMLDLENPDSSFWRSLEKMLAPRSCELEDYPGTLPDAAVWGCPNIASALFPPPAMADLNLRDAEFNQVVVVGRRVNVRALPRLGTSVVGRLSNEAVEFNRPAWQELRRTAPETTDDPIDGWTPVILPNQVQGYVYNRYVYHPQGPRALFEHIDGRWQLLRIVVSDEPLPEY